MTQLTHPSALDRAPLRLSFAPVDKLLHHLQLWRAKRALRVDERHALAQLRAEIADPRLLKDVGATPATSHMERFLLASLEQQR